MTIEQALDGKKILVEAWSQVMDVKLEKGIRLSRVRISTQNLR